MRTNIDIDDDLMAEAMKAGDFPTKKAAVEAGLRELVENEQRRKALRAMRGLGWDGDLDQMRQDQTPVYAAEPCGQFIGEPK